MNIKNNTRLWGVVTFLMFLTIIAVNELRRKVNRVSLDKHLGKVIGTTAGCDKNIRSSLHTLHYKFSYKNTVYSGMRDFDIDKRGDICKGANFWVIFDSLNPGNNQILLDSGIVNQVE